MLHPWRRLVEKVGSEYKFVFVMHVRSLRADESLAWYGNRCYWHRGYASLLAVRHFLATRDPAWFGPGASLVLIHRVDLDLWFWEP